MAYTIRKIEAGDLPAIAEFHCSIYKRGSSEYKDLAMLEWLLKDPFNVGRYNGFLAINEQGKVVGMVGYAMNQYRFGERQFTGVIPMSWLVAPQERGIMGIRLLLEVLKLGDFSFALGGTQLALNSYSAARLKPIGNAGIYTKVFSPYKFATYNGSLCRVDMVKSVLFFRRKRLCALSPELELQPFQENDDHVKGIYDQMAMIPTKERNHWIMDCPVVESYAFKLVYKGQEMGNCICYVSTGQKNIKRARIVLIPFAGGNREFYRHTIAHLENFLLEKGSCSVSLVSLYPEMSSTIKMCGYRHYPKLQGYEVYVRKNLKELNTSDFSDWFLSYYESDKGHLHF